MNAFKSTLIKNLSFACLLCWLAGAMVACNDRPVKYPWYDHERDQYKEYSAEEIRQFIPQKAQPAPSFSGIGAIAQIAIYLLLAALVAAIVYFLARYFRQKKSTLPDLASEELPSDPVYLPVSEIDLPFHLQSSQELGKLIEEALKNRDLRRCAIYIFLFLVARLSERQMLQTRKSGTAREYARRMKKLLPDLGEEIEYSRLLFEQALYGESAPEFGALDLWRKLRQGLTA
jgi:hypothetical protein